MTVCEDGGKGWELSGGFYRGMESLWGPLWVTARVQRRLSHSVFPFIVSLYFFRGCHCGCEGEIYSSFSYHVAPFYFQQSKEEANVLGTGVR